jgi:hypothetical protein
MKAIIKVCTAAKNFNPDQLQILRRVQMVLIEHDFSVALFMKQPKYKQVKLHVI